MEPVKIMVARFPSGRRDDPDTTDWLVTTVVGMKTDDRIREIVNTRVDNTPITMGRNLVIRRAQEEGADFLLWVDNDMSPDAYLPSNPHKISSDATAVPFFPAAMNFLWKKRQENKPSVIAAPYCGPPPLENVYIFRWETSETDRPSDEPNMALEQFTRYEAAVKEGIQEVAALPTGLMLLDMRVFDGWDPPYTYYEWEDETESRKASTEDVTLTRDMSMRGIGVYCHWNTWAGHWKWKRVAKPHILSSKSISARFRDSVLRDYNINRGEQLVMVGEDNGDSNGNGLHRRPHADVGGDHQSEGEDTA